MSYDIYLRDGPPRCSACGYLQESPELPDPTYNLTPIFDLALTGEPLPNPDVGEAGVVLLGAKTDRPRGLRIISGLKAKDSIDTIERALERMCDPAILGKFRGLEPENGWGDLGGAIRVMEWLLSAAKEYPEWTWDIR